MKSRKRKFIIVSVIFVAIILWLSIGTIIDYQNEKPIVNKSTVLENCINYDYCKKFKENPKLISMDGISQFFYLQTEYKLQYLFFIIPLSIIVLSSLIFKNTFKNNTIHNYLTRINYKQMFKRAYKKSLSPLMIIPLFFIIFLIVNVANVGHIDFTYRLNYLKNIAGIDANLLHKWYLIYIYMVLNVTLHYLFVVNLGIISFRNNQHLILNIITSYVNYLIIWLFSEIILFDIIFKNWVHRGSFIFGGIYNFEINDAITDILFNIILVIATGLIIKVKYYNKEKFLIENKI